MSDLELLELIRNKSPEELTSAEIEALRQGIAASPELRREVAERVEMEQYLHQALARVSVSVDEIIGRADSEAGVSSNTRLRAVLAAAAIAGIVIGAYVVTAIVSPSEPDKSVVAAPDAELRDRATSSEVLKPKEAETSGPSPSDLLLSATRDKQKGEAEQVATATTDATGTAAEPMEWQPGEGSDTSSGAIDLFRTFDPGKPPPAADDLQRWFAPVEGHGGTFGTRDVGGGNWGLIEGVLRLKSPLKSGHAIRLTIWDWHSLQIHVWAGNSGATLRHLGQLPTKPWAGYTTARKDASPIPKLLQLAATDEDRFWKTNPRNPVTLQLRHSDGLLTLSHGDIRLLDVPMSVPPTEIYCDGSALVRELAVTLAAELPHAVSASPATRTMQPASQSWAKPAEGTGTLSLGGDGGIELRAEKNAEPAIAKLNVNRTGVSELVCEVLEPQPGTGICLLDAQGNPIYLAAFAENKAVGLTQIGSMNPQQPSLEIQGNVNERAIPFVAGRTWIKLTLASGWVKLWVSRDGRHFARAGDPTALEQSISGIGLYAFAHPSPRSIRLADFSLHELGAINQLASAELREKADGVATSPNMVEFRAAAEKAQPAEVDRSEWMRACAVRSLATGVTPALGEALIEYLWSESFRMEMPIERRLRLLEQLSMLTPSWNNDDLAQRHLRRYEQLGREMSDRGQSRPYSRIAAPQMLAPLWSQSPVPYSPASVARQEALELALGRQWEALKELVDRLEFFHLPENSDAENFYRWLASLSDRTRPIAAGTARVASSVEWRHPFTTELSKEGFNVLADLQVALKSKAYRDACQVIGSANASGMLGLLPDSQDPELSVSLPATVAIAMREHPRFRETMTEQFGPLGRLRVRQAIASGDDDAVEAATIQFYGTEAAAEAHLWLADRAISSGAFAAAQSHYRAARTTAPQTLSARLAASEQLAAALTGHDAGLKPTGAIELGESSVQANEIVTLSNQLRASRASENVRGGANFADPEALRLPPVGAYEAVERARFDGEVGQRPHEVPNLYRQPIPGWPERSVDWVAEQLHVQPLKDRLLISNRFQLASYDLETGSLQWRAGLGGDMALAREWPLSPMRPLATSELAFVRRLRTNGPTLAAIELAGGQLKWETRLEGEHWIVSDPMLVGSTLYACTIRHAELGFSLCLAAFDPLTGVVLRERELVDLRETWGQIRDCQLMSLEESLVITSGGAVLRCDLMGNLRWARRRLWVPPAVDTGWVWQAHQPPTLVGGRLYVVQPCVPGVVALEPDNGRLLWRCDLTSARRILGVNESQVFVATNDGVCALHTGSGKPLWHYRANLLAGEIFSKSDGLLLARREPVENEKRSQVALTWLDTATGQPKHSCALSELEQPQTFLGPMLMHQQRVWALYGKDLQDPTRALLELTPE